MGGREGQTDAPIDEELERTDEGRSRELSLFGRSFLCIAANFLGRWVTCQLTSSTDISIVKFLARSMATCQLARSADDSTG